MNSEKQYFIEKQEFHYSNQFTKREIDIIKYIGDGFNNTEIGQKLFISTLTVKKHRNNILAKSNCRNTAELIKQTVLQGLISLFLLL